MRCLRTIVFLAALAVPGLAGADGYFNSSESGCNGSDPNVLMCDDFESGTWYTKDCDQANAAGGVLSQTKGWCGTIFANPISPAGAADCNGGANGSRCAATSGQLGGGQGGRNMADHSFPNGQEVQDIYVRYYRKNSPGFSYSGQKVMTFNRCCNPGGGIFWAGMGFNIGQGSASTGAPDIGITNNLASNQIYRQNQGNDIALTSGNWYYFEVHIKLNTPGSSNGVFELWVNNCGSAGTSCSGAPTLRARHTNIDWGKNSSNGGIGTVWLENWANNADGRGSQGQEWYDDLKVSKVGPIGMKGSTGGGGSGPVAGAPPSAPTGVTIR
jgi:hypothetical protein